MDVTVRDHCHKPLKHSISRGFSSFSSTRQQQFLEHYYYDYYCYFIIIIAISITTTSFQRFVNVFDVVTMLQQC